MNCDGPRRVRHAMTVRVHKWELCIFSFSLHCFAVCNLTINPTPLFPPLFCPSPRNYFPLLFATKHAVRLAAGDKRRPCPRLACRCTAVWRLRRLCRGVCSGKCSVSSPKVWCTHTCVTDAKKHWQYIPTEELQSQKLKEMRMRVEPDQSSLPVWVRVCVFDVKELYMNNRFVEFTSPTATPAVLFCLCRGLCFPVCLPHGCMDC